MGVANAVTRNASADFRGEMAYKLSLQMFLLIEPGKGTLLWK
jgi:hypothetical protein